MVGTVSWISIAPVKGMRVQLAEAVELTDGGLRGDREFILVDEQDRMVNGKRFGSLTEVVPERDFIAGTLELRFPGGGRVIDQISPGSLEPITFFGQEEQARPASTLLSEAISSHVGQALRIMVRPEERMGVDRGQRAGVSFLGERSLESLREAGLRFNREEGGLPSTEADPGAIDQRRFRMNFGVAGIEPYGEDGWLGKELILGTARVRIHGQVGRCAVTTRNPDSGVTDLKTLHFLRASRSEDESAEALPFGVYGEVLDPGLVSLGDRIDFAD